MTKTHSGILALLGLAAFVLALIFISSLTVSASQTTPTVPTLSPGATGNASTTNISVAGSFAASSTTLPSVFAGSVAVGSTSPYARLSLQANTSDPYKDTLVAVASSSPTATSTLFSLNASGAVTIASTTPTLQAGLTVGTAGSSNGTTTISTGKIQWDGYNSAGSRICVFFLGTTLTAVSGACNP